MASRPPSAPPIAVLDHHARQLGFHDYATYSAWKQKQDIGLRGPGAQPQAAPTNWLQNILGQIPIHPVSLFNRISQKFGAATGQDQ